MNGLKLLETTPISKN